jgi:ribosome-associated protein
MQNPEKTALTDLIIAALEDTKGLDIRLLDVRSLTPITDFMVICTGTSGRHVVSLAQNVIEKAKEAGFRPLNNEGLDSTDWALVDLNSVLVHVMQAPAREYYSLEKLWDVVGRVEKVATV